MTTWKPSTFTAASIRELEHRSIRDFVASCSEFFAGGARVLDYGCGRQPYRDVVEAAGGLYEPYDAARHPANVSGENVGEEPRPGDWRDVVLCTQVAQYWPGPSYMLAVVLRNLIRPGGVLILTYPTNWDEVEPDDLWRFTRQGMERLLLAPIGYPAGGFKEIVRHERRAEVELGGFRFPLGYGCVARA